MAIAFADKNPQEDGVFGNLHMLFLFCQERESENSHQPYGGEATGERQHCVQQRLQPISIPGQIECLQAERGKRCVTAAHTDHEKLPESRRHKNRPFGIRKRCEEPDDERTANVHDKGAEREKLTAAFSNESRHPESRSSPKCAAEDYQNISEHRKTPSCLEGVISSRGFLPHPREKANSIAEINSTAWRLYIDQTLTKTRRQS